MLLGSMTDLFLQELESLLIDMDGDELAGSSGTQVLTFDPRSVSNTAMDVHDTVA